MRIRYRIGVMPGPWPSGPAGRDLFWRFVSLCEQSEIDSLWFSERLSSPRLLPIARRIIAAASAVREATRSPTRSEPSLADYGDHCDDRCR